MNKIIILENNGGRLANQLWNFASVYSYCLENGYVIENFSFFKYNKYYNLEIDNKIIEIFFKWNINYKIKIILYKLFVFFIKLTKKKFIVADGNKEFVLSLSQDAGQQKIINFIRSRENGTFYFCGWLFRNNLGLEKFHEDIKKYFRPKEEFIKRPKELIEKLKIEYQLIVGVHIRQGDYKTWHGGKFYFDCGEVRVLLDNFLDSQINIDRSKIVFVICSDGPIDGPQFIGLNYIKGPGTEIEDLYILSKTDIIIGSNSTYGGWAAYYGKIPFIIFSKDKINWPILGKN